MKTIVLIMQRASVAQGLMRKVRERDDLQVLYEPDYAQADVAIRSHFAQAALIEVGEGSERDADYCLGLCGWLRRETPDCKLLLMCPERREDAIKRAIQAKKAKEIDDFVFYDVSMEYLVNDLLAL